MTLGKTLLADRNSGISFNSDTDVRITILHVEINWDFSYLFAVATTSNKGYSTIAFAHWKSTFNIKLTVPGIEGSPLILWSVLILNDCCQ